MIAAARPGIRENVGCTTVYTDCSTVTDAFNRADYGDNTLGVADTGQRWSNVPGNAWGGLTTSIITDGYWTTQGTNPNKAQAKVITIDHYRAMRTAINVGGNNQDVTFTFSTADDDYTGCVVRANADTSCGYEIGFSHYGNGTVSKYVDGVGGSPIATWSATSLNTSHTARVRVWRNSLKVWRDGTLVADITIDPDDAGGHCETDWTYFAIGENHGGSGGSAPTQQTVYTNTWVDDLSISAPINQTIFDYTGATQTFTVPAGVTSLTVECWGAQGGAAFGTPNGTGLGGYIKSTVTVTPGETLNVEVGGRPTSSGGGYNGGGSGGPSSSSGGGGGGASDVRRGGPALGNRVAVAGGGGGAGTNSNGPDGATYRDGGPGGALIGGDSPSASFFGSAAYGGKGGTQSAGGAAGTPTTGGGVTATAGALGTGGQGAGQGSGTAGTGAGGGGGGYYGGGGGAWLLSSRMPGGGGGSNYSSGTILTNSQGIRAGHGRVIVTY